LRKIQNLGREKKLEEDQRPGNISTPPLKKREIEGTGLSERRVRTMRRERIGQRE